MSSNDDELALEAQTATPIAQLDPKLADIPTRAVSGIVTLVWPYNSSTNSLAFNLAEADARLRRTKGNVRIQLQGSSAKAVAAMKLGGGDMVTIGLDGAQWVKDGTAAPVPASRSEWQLQYTEKLMLRAAVGPNQEVKRLVVVQPRSIPTPPDTEPIAQSAASNLDRPVSPASVPLLSNLTDTEPTEYASPAFLKRARLSYGALFEGDDDALDEDGATQGGARKRTKFGRKPNEWRYASQSRSPSPEPPRKTPSRTAEAAVEVNMEQFEPSRPHTLDEGVQTMDVDLSPRPARQQEASDEPSQVGTEQHEAPPRRPSPPKVSPIPSAPSPKQSTTSTATDGAPRPHSPPTAKATQSPPSIAVTKKLSPLSTKGAGNATSTTHHSNLFGNVASSGHDYDMPRFGRPIHSPLDGSFDLADQVRFGFSHVPETDHPAPPAAPQVMAAQSGTEGVPAATPVSHLAQTLREPSPGSKYQEMNSYIGPAEQEMEDESGNPFAMATEAPAVETFGDGDRWMMVTEDPSYNQVEGGHYGVNALEEGKRTTGDEPAIRSDEIDVDKVPPGFSSYGAENVDEIASDSEDSEHDVDQSYIPGEDLVKNEELEDELDDDVAVDDNDDQTYNSEGEVIEEGDYDQRIYNEPESDSDGLEDEKFMVDDEIYARDNHPDVIDEDELRNVIADPDGEMDGTIQSEAEEDDMDKEEDAEEVADNETDGGYNEEQSDDYDDGQGEMYDDGVDDERIEGNDYDEYDDEDDEEGSRASSRSQNPYAHPQASSRVPLQAQKQPEVIDLISDSEEEEDDNKGSIGVTYAASRPPTSNPTHSERNDEAVDEQELTVRDGDIDPVLLEAVASGQGALNEKMVREAEEAAMEEELEAEMEQAYEEQVHGGQHNHSHEYGETQGDNATSGDITLPRGVPSNVDTHNPPTAVLPTSNAWKASEATTSSPAPYISSVDGPGSSPSRRAFHAEDDETTDTRAASGDEPGDIDAPSSTADTIKSLNLTKREQQVPDPQPSKLVSDEAELVADIVPAGAQSRDMMTNPPESTGHENNELSPAEKQEEDVVMEDQVHVLSGKRAAVTEGASAYQETRPAQTYEVNSQQASVAPYSSSSSRPFIGLGQDEPMSDQTGATEKFPPTLLETQASDVFMSQPDPLPSSSQSDDMEPTQQQTGSNEDSHNISQAGEDADNTGDEDEDLSVDDAREQEAEDNDMGMSDVDAQIEAQIRVEIEQTTVIEQVVEVVEDVSPGIQDLKEEDVMQDDVIGHEMRDIMEKDLGELISQDLDQEEAVMNDNAMSEDAEEEKEAQVVQTQDGRGSLQPRVVPATELVVEIPAKPSKDMGTADVADEVNADQEVEGANSPVSEAVKASSEVVFESRETPGINDGEQYTAVKSADRSQDTEAADAPSTNVGDFLDTSSRPMTWGHKAHDDDADEQASVDEAGVDTDTRREVSKPAKEPATTNKRTKSSRAKEKEPVDPSVELARATLNKRGRSKKPADSAESNNTHWHHTRQHSPPGRCSLTPIVDEIIEQDSSVALARAALASPSPRPQSLRSSDPKELTRRLRTGLSEYTPLRTVRTSKHRPDHFDVLAIAVSPGPHPQRTKSRDYVMIIHVTDPSISPNHAVKVKLSATHRAYLPVGIQAGQGIMLRNFAPIETSGKKDDCGLEATEESSWAVFAADDDKTIPEIKPTPLSEEDEVEDAVVEYMHDLRAWYSGLDDTVKDKVAKAASA